jgi:hypothetical protein
MARRNTTTVSGTVIGHHLSSVTAKGLSARLRAPCVSPRARFSAVRRISHGVTKVDSASAGTSSELLGQLGAFPPRVVQKVPILPPKAQCCSRQCPSTGRPPTTLLRGTPPPATCRDETPGGPRDRGYWGLSIARLSRVGRIIALITIFFAPKTIIRPRTGGRPRGRRAAPVHAVSLAARTKQRCPPQLHDVHCFGLDGAPAVSGEEAPRNAYR